MSRILTDVPNFYKHSNTLLVTVLTNYFIFQERTKHTTYLFYAPIQETSRCDVVAVLDLLLVDLHLRPGSVPAGILRAIDAGKRGIRILLLAYKQFILE